MPIVIKYISPPGQQPGGLLYIKEKASSGVHGRPLSQWASRLEQDEALEKGGGPRCQLCTISGAPGQVVTSKLPIYPTDYAIDSFLSRTPGTPLFYDFLDK